MTKRKSTPALNAAVNLSKKLHIAPCTYEAAKFAVEHWHYSKTMPSGKTVRFGIWEDGAFVGAIVFGSGANHMIGRPYGLTQQQVCELVRVAMREHDSPVSQALSVCLRLLKKAQAGLRLVVSYADTEQGHHGGIYQATNWIYAGRNEGGEYRRIGHKRLHARSVRAKTGDATRYEMVKGSPKHRYLYALDKSMRDQIQSLSQPYPKREHAPEAS